MDTHLVCLIGVCSGCDGSPSCLQEERDEVTSDEGNGICPWPETRVLFTVHNDDAGKAKIDGCCKEGRTDGEDDKIHQEHWIRKRVLQSRSVKLSYFQPR